MIKENSYELLDSLTNIFPINLICSYETEEKTVHVSSIVTAEAF
jgi:hypothetical protein